jgi:PAS domain-containing protein
MFNQQTPSHPDKNLAQRVDLDFALQAAGLGLWEIDLTTNLIRWDQRCRALFGLTAPTSNQLWYQEAIRGVHPDDLDRVRETIRQAMDPHSGGQLDLTCRTIGAQDRQLRWIRFTGRSYFSQTGQPLRLAGIAHEITQQVEAQLRGQQTAQHLQAVLDSSPAVIGFLKPVHNTVEDVIDFEVVVCNQRLAQLSQKPLDQLLHQPFTQISHVLWHDQTFANLRYVLQTGEPFYQEQPQQTSQGEG